MLRDCAKVALVGAGRSVGAGYLVLGTGLVLEAWLVLHLAGEEALTDGPLA